MHAIARGFGDEPPRDRCRSMPRDTGVVHQIGETRRTDRRSFASELQIVHDRSRSRGCMVTGDDDRQTRRHSETRAPGASNLIGNRHPRSPYVRQSFTGRERPVLLNTEGVHTRSGSGSDDRRECAITSAREEPFGNARRNRPSDPSGIRRSRAPLQPPDTELVVSNMEHWAERGRAAIERVQGPGHGGDMRAPKQAHSGTRSSSPRPDRRATKVVPRDEPGSDSVANGGLTEAAMALELPDSVRSQRRSER